MRSDLPGVPLLRDVPIGPGQRWIYSAGFNVPADRHSPGRIDVELADLDRLLGRGARVAILSHQGSHRDGTAGSLEHVAAYLQQRLGRPVGYAPLATGADARRRADHIPDGAAVLFGNTRTHAGEEDNDPGLAADFAALGERVAIGGFSKAHRRHASNVGILDHRPGVATDSLLQEIALLAPWAGPRDDRFSVAVLGGTKIEKLSPGLEATADTYDVIIPGGAVLNALLAATGFDVGTSSLGADPARAVATAQRVLSRPTRAQICLPTELIVVPPSDRRPQAARTVRTTDGGCPGASIVDLVPTPTMTQHLKTVQRQSGRAFVAGPPGLYREGHHRIGNAVVSALSDPRVEALLLGGDTVAELPWSGATSTGGGAALHYLAHGTVPVLEALAASAPVMEGRH